MLGTHRTFGRRSSTSRPLRRQLDCPHGSLVAKITVALTAALSAACANSRVGPRRFAGEHLEGPRAGDEASTPARRERDRLGPAPAHERHDTRLGALRQPPTDCRWSALRWSGLKRRCRRLKARSRTCARARLTSPVLTDNILNSAPVETISTAYEGKSVALVNITIDGASAIRQGGSDPTQTPRH